MLRPSRQRSRASRAASSSTAPPPTVPRAEPPARTSIRAPGPRGVEPRLATTVATTAPRPA